MSIISARVLGPLQEFSATIRLLRAPLLLSVLSMLVLSIPAQIFELYLILARDWQRLWLQGIFAIVSLGVLSLFIAHVARALTRTDEEVNTTRGKAGTQGSITRTIPIVLGLLPLLGCVIGLYRALLSTSTDVLRRTMDTIEAFKSPEKVVEAVRKVEAAIGGKAEFNTAMLPKLRELLNTLVPEALLDLPARTAELSIAIYAAIAICAALAVLLVLLMILASPSLEGNLRARIFHPATGVVFPLLFIVVTGLFAAQFLNVGKAAGYDFTGIPRVLGTLTIINLFGIFLVFFCSALTRWSDRNGIPLLSPLIALAVAFSLFNWNDNHQVRLASSTAAELAKRKIGADGKVPPPLWDAFQEWLAKRPADYVKKFDGKPYPIYVVAAQGGGMYAANLAGLTLARLYDRCPAVRHHVFAVSGVSGGSVGAGYFAALLNEPTTTPKADTCALEAPKGGKGTLETKMEELLRADFLSPVAASLLFPDLVQRFIPYPIEAFDRARAFEAGVEKAWDSVMKSTTNPLRLPFWRHWSPEGAAPMLLLNTTIVENGRQVAVAPVEIDPNSGFKTLGLESFQESLGLPATQDVPLSAAMSISARFPLVMPAGLMKLRHRDVRLVDGGYFENSGAEVAMAVIRKLQENICPSETVDYSNCKRTDGDKRTFAFRTIVLTDYDDQSDVLRDPSNTGEGLGELLSPVRTMYNSRIARGELVVGLLQNFRPGQASLNTIPTIMVSLNQRLYFLPLGWQLSAQVQDIIGSQIGEPANCGYGVEAPAFVDAWRIISGVDLGLQMLADERAKATKRELEIGFTRRTPFQNVLFKLKGNQCAIFTALGADGIAPRKSHCVDPHKVSVTFQLNPTPEFSQLSAAFEPYRAQLRKTWQAEVTQKYGKSYANIEKTVSQGGACGGGTGGTFECNFEAAPCDMAYYQFVE